MKVIEQLERATSPQISVEIIPPRRGGDISRLYDAVRSIMPFNPPFIDVTSHSAEAIFEAQADGSYRKKIKRKSPGTFGLCAAIKYRFDIDPVPHLLCTGFTREETEDALIELNYLGVQNVLCIRGDAKTVKEVKDGRTVNTFALDLVSQVNSMNQGRYLDDLQDAKPTNFCIGVAAYPEKHFEAPSMAFDLENLRRKQDAGAHYAVTQMFFDNRRYLDYVAEARTAGVTMPILPGLKILTQKGHLNRIPSVFHVNFPEELIQRLLHAQDNRQATEVGVEWAYQQCIGLLESGCRHLHFYIMQDTTPFLMLMDRLSRQL